MNPQRGNALHAGNGIMRYTPNVGFVGTDMLVYRICSTDCPDECSESVVILRVGNEDDCFIPTLFTPNNDGINDRLIIPCLETSRYPNNKVIVFNEWGDAVFTASPYLNDWEGTIKGNSLPVGTYFYIMDFGDGSTPRRSFLILER
jgi:gliding motility-associated-like protein